MALSEITPFDAAQLARMIETALRAVEIGDFDRRLATLEREVQDAKNANDQGGYDNASSA